MVPESLHKRKLAVECTIFRKKHGIECSAPPSMPAVHIPTCQAKVPERHMLPAKCSRAQIVVLVVVKHFARTIRL
jgi:hypothetical protein